MPIPRIAIVGRPNVGKSSLLNLIARERISIVDDEPGVTRDRVATIVELDSPDQLSVKPAEIVDTGGFGVYVADGKRYDEIGSDLSRLTGDIEAQIAEAVSTADVILFAVDCQAGITPADEEIARLLREQRLGDRARGDELVPVHVVATKCDGPKWEAHAYELSALGFGEPMPCSATTKYFRRDMLDRLYEITPGTDDADDRVASADLRIAIIGKRNAGKSTLINSLAGEERVIVSEIPGTTRDAIDVRFDFDGRSVVAIDTAGLRKKKSFQGRLEHYAFDRAKNAIERSDVVLLVIDANDRISQVDQHLAQLVQAAFKPCVIVVNKWDEISHRKNRHGNPISAEDFEPYIRDELKGLAVCPIAIISAKEGLNLRATIEIAFELHEQASERVGTGELNRLVEGILTKRGPSNKLGTIAKVYYAAQVTTNPPTIVLIVNRPDLFTPNYRRYLLNRFREALPFEEVPIRLFIRGRSRKDAKADGKAEGKIGQRRLRPSDVDAPRPVPGERGPIVIDLADAPEDLSIHDLLREMPDEADAYFDE